MKIFKKEISRRKWFLGFTKIRNQRDRGAHWITLVESFFDYRMLITLGTLISLKLTQVGYHFAFWKVLALLAIAGILLEGLKWLIGWQDYKKWKLWELENEWMTKNETMAPFNKELMADMKAICKKLGVKSHFKDLDRG